VYKFLRPLPTTFVVRGSPGWSLPEEPWLSFGAGSGDRSWRSRLAIAAGGHGWQSQLAVTADSHSRRMITQKAPGVGK